MNCCVASIPWFSTGLYRVMPHKFTLNLEDINITGTYLSGPYNLFSVILSMAQNKKKHLRYQGKATRLFESLE